MWNVEHSKGYQVSFSFTSCQSNNQQKHGTDFVHELSRRQKRMRKWPSMTLSYRGLLGIDKLRDIREGRGMRKGCLPLWNLSKSSVGAQRSPHCSAISTISISCCPILISLHYYQMSLRSVADKGDRKWDEGVRSGNDNQAAHIFAED